MEKMAYLELEHNQVFNSLSGAVLSYVSTQVPIYIRYKDLSMWYRDDLGSYIERLQCIVKMDNASAQF